MKENEREKRVEMYIPQGHTLFDMLDTEVEGYDMGEATKTEEVTIKFEQNNA